MKIKNVYIKPDGQICACIVPVPDRPNEKSFSGDQWKEHNAWCDYEAALQSCKDSSVRFEDQDAMNRLLGFRVERDTFYPLTAMLTFTCNNDCQADVGDCCHPSNCAKVARLIPEAPDLLKQIPTPKCEHDYVIKFGVLMCQNCGMEYVGVPEAKEEKTIEAGRILALKEAQKFLHDELGDDWNDLCQTLYEGRILAAMYKFKGTAPIVEESQTVKIEVNKNAIPRKAKLVEAYETDHQIIIMFGKEEIPESHSCDDMGCGSFSHVKYILTKP